MADQRRREYSIRPIAAADDAQVATLIRTVMPEFGAEGPGYAIMDPEVSAMTDAYSGPRAGYWVIDRAGAIVGGGGFAQLSGAGGELCELRKMYFYPETRGLGLGRDLLAMILDRARAAGFRGCYLETLARMDAARRLYERAGFRKLGGPMGDTGHFGCNSWYLRDL